MVGIRGLAALLPKAAHPCMSTGLAVRRSANLGMPIPQSSFSVYNVAIVVDPPSKDRPAEFLLSFDWLDCFDALCSATPTEISSSTNHLRISCSEGSMLITKSRVDFLWISTSLPKASPVVVLLSALERCCCSGMVEGDSVEVFDRGHWFPAVSFLSIARMHDAALARHEVAVLESAFPEGVASSASLSLRSSQTYNSISFGYFREESAFTAADWPSRDAFPASFSAGASDRHMGSTMIVAIPQLTGENPITPVLLQLASSPSGGPTHSQKILGSLALSNLVEADFIGVQVTAARCSMPTLLQVFQETVGSQVEMLRREGRSLSILRFLEKKKVTQSSSTACSEQGLFYISTEPSPLSSTASTPVLGSTIKKRDSTLLTDIEDFSVVPAPCWKEACKQSAINSALRTYIDSDSGSNADDDSGDDVEFLALKNLVTSQRPDTAVMLVNPQRVVGQWSRWRRALSRVHMYYAVKCNNDPVLLETLADLGCGFDCASVAELDNVVVNMGVSSDRVIYSNPCKQEHGLQHARALGVKLTVFDNVDELVKVAELYPEAELLLRIVTDDEDAQCPLSCKFGAHPGSWAQLLDVALSLKLTIKGVHFHVGSGCSRLGCFTQAISSAHSLFLLAKQKGIDMTMLDIGGGFPGALASSGLQLGRVTNSPTSSSPDTATAVSFEDLADEIRPLLDRYFPTSSGVSVVAEPGRFFAASSHTLAVKIFARRRPMGRSGVKAELERSPTLLQDSSGPSLLELKGDVSENSCGSIALVDSDKGTRYTQETPSGYLYYINDGVYGSFNCIVYDHAVVMPRILSSSSFKGPQSSIARVPSVPKMAPCMSPLEQHLSANFGSDVSSVSTSASSVYSQASTPNSSSGFARSTIFGQTCDGFDCIVKDVSMPILEVGDWLLFDNMGAYTVCAASTFNGFPLPKKVYLQSSVEQLRTASP